MLSLFLYLLSGFAHAHFISWVLRLYKQQVTEEALLLAAPNYKILETKKGKLVIALLWPLFASYLLLNELFS